MSVLPGSKAGTKVKLACPTGDPELVILWNLLVAKRLDEKLVLTVKAANGTLMSFEEITGAFPRHLFREIPGQDALSIAIAHKSDQVWSPTSHVV